MSKLFLIAGHLLLLLAPVIVAQDFEVSKEFRQYCGMCHGEAGDGRGKAARYLYPKPRDLVDGRLRFVTAENLVGTAADIKKVIKSGIPNTSMQSWKVLSDQLINRLVSEVMQMQSFGARERVEKVLQEDGILLDNEGKMTPAGEAVIEQYVIQQTQPGSRWVAPANNNSVTEAVKVGREIYLKQNCHKCHGDDGSGSWGMDLVDDKGFPLFARDLKRDPFKAGHQFEDVARIIRLGMPGTVMPSSTNLTDGELISLVKYIETLSVNPKNRMGNSQRYDRAIGFRRE